MNQQFIRLLDSQPLVPADAIIVLRNWDLDLTRERYERALDLVLRHYAPIMVVTNDEHTAAEATRIFNIAMELMWKKIIIITHQCHHYRAYLTFLQQFQHYGTDIISSPVPGGWDRLEWDKIAEYQQTGDVATYEDGINELTRRHQHYVA